MIQQRLNCLLKGIWVKSSSSSSSYSSSSSSPFFSPTSNSKSNEDEEEEEEEQWKFLKLEPITRKSLYWIETTKKKGGSNRGDIEFEEGLESLYQKSKFFFPVPGLPLSLSPSLYLYLNRS
jgi:hypothetical protein